MPERTLEPDSTDKLATTNDDANRPNPDTLPGFSYDASSELDLSHDENDLLPDNAIA
ncbi:Nn.00g024380.m01.CDS01 [Neocucurbitaria sp. VM-36]